ncbi:MAG: DUF2183 domain-containing protein [Anaerolineaceae bacterium]|nr:DUF2183 domain-containing protein [Anaerolineaceae bacterium]
MSGSNLGKLIKKVDAGWSRLKFKAKWRLGRFDLLDVLVYFGFGTARQVYVRGRVLECKGMAGAAEDDSLWRNFKQMARRFSSDEIPGAVVQVNFLGAAVQAKTDHEGFFEVTLKPQRPPAPDKLWHPVEVRLLEPQHPRQPQPVIGTGEILAPPAQAEFGVISDIDDTVVETAATSLIKMLRIVLFSNAHTRLPFEGVSEFYRALQAGQAGTQNPIFYVSSSPWNLYDLLVDFFRIHHIPHGPLLLQDYGLEPGQWLHADHQKHKLRQIERVLTILPDLPFILIGDSGQQDPEIYREVVHRYPDRILAIYIRDVSLDRRQAEIETIAAGLGPAGVEMLLVKDTQLAMQHAAAQGFISAEGVSSP